jgi:hypothetical protein
MLQQGDNWTIRLSVPADDGDKKYWETAGERAGAIASLLESSCNISPDKISSAAIRPGKESSDSDKILVSVGPAVLPRMKASEAPLDPPSAAAKNSMA